MCSTLEMRLAMLRAAIDDVALTARADRAGHTDPGELATRLADLWAMIAELDPALAARLRGYGPDAARDIRGLDDAQQAAGRLSALKVRLATKAGNTGRLFGSVSPSDIADAVRAAGGPELDRRRIEIPSPIKTIGAHQVQVRLHPEVTATIEIEIVGN